LRLASKVVSLRQIAPGTLPHFAGATELNQIPLNFWGHSVVSDVVRDGNELNLMSLID